MTQNIILTVVWVLFLLSVADLWAVSNAGGFSTRPTTMTIVLVVAGFLAGGCISLTRAWLRQRRGSQ